MASVAPVMMFGNMLFWDVSDVGEDDTDVQDVIKFAVSFIKTHKERAKEKSSEVYRIPEIKDLKKYKLVYSDDDKTPYSFKHSDPTGTPTEAQAGLAYMGFLYRLSLVYKTETHRFEISTYKPGDTHIYSYTVIDNDNAASTNQSQGSSQKTESRGDHVTCDSQSEVDGNEPGVKDVCGEDPKLKILSQNIWNFYSVDRSEKTYVQRIELLGQVLQSSGADIIGFQEVRYQHGSGLYLGPNQVAHLAHHLPGYQFVYQPAMTNSLSLRRGRTEEGLAIFSRFPILNHDFILLDRNLSEPADGHQRICLHAEIQTPVFGKIDMYVSHLSLHAAARERSAVQIWEFMERSTGPAFLLGDLNAEPEEASVRYLQGLGEIAGKQVPGLVDTWFVSYMEPGLTFSSVDPTPIKRIDYVFMSRSERVSVDEVRLVSTGSIGAGAASDHYGVLATFKQPELLK